MTTEFRIQNNITLIADLIADYANFSPDDHLIRSKVRDVVKERTLQIPFPASCKVFWQLKEKWWMQFFDGKLHHLGSQVFDQGLHNKDSTEPGYYRSMENAATYASQCMLLSPGVPFYKMLHRTVCSHFDGEKTSTEVTSEHIGLFTSINFSVKRCIGKVKFLYDHYPEYAEIVDKNIQRESLFSCCKSEYPNDVEGRRKILESRGVTEEEFLAWRSENASGWKMKEQIEKRIEELNSEIEKRCADWGLAELGVSSLASLRTWGSKDCCIRFECPREKIELIAEHLFKEYNQRISKLNSIDDKVSCIGDFCQMLEWLHGFPDGQTRTDMLLLAKELCRHKSNPPILDETHIPHYSTKSEWLAYLKVGIKKWAEIAAET